MKKFSNTLSCAEVNKKDLVEFLSSMGFQPTRTSVPNYWYLSPFRDEKTASFKVNQKKNSWYDFGIQEGGSLVDLCMRLFNCDVKGVLHHFSGTEMSLTIVPQRAIENYFEEASSIENLVTRQLQSFALLSYLKSRRIPLDVARKTCCEAIYDIKGKSYYAIAFKNNSGGFELRNKFFKGSTSPKDITYLDNGTKRLTVFEGFFNYLSFESILLHQGNPASDFLILNSVGLLDRAKSIVEKSELVLLFLDNDKAGNEATKRALSCGRHIDDYREAYAGYKDLNEWLCSFGKGLKNKDSNERE